MALLRLSLAALLLAPTFSSVIDLAAESWPSTVDGRSTVLVVFSIPSCAECDRLDALLPSVDEALNRSPPPVRVARVNGNAEPGLRARYGVAEFPELLLFLPGRAQPLSYTGELRADALVHWARAAQAGDVGGPAPAAGAALGAGADGSGTRWMREVAAALAGTPPPPPPPPPRPLPTATAAAAAAARAPAATDDGSAAGQAAASMGAAFDGSIADAAAAANARSARVQLQLASEAAAAQGRAQADFERRAGAVVAPLQRLVGALAPLLPSRQQLAGSREFRELAAIVAKQAEALSPAQLDAVAGAQPPAARLPLLVALLLNLSDDAGDLLLRAVGVHDGHAAMATPRAAAPPVERAPPVELAAPAFSMAARMGGGGSGAPT